MAGQKEPVEYAMRPQAAGFQKRFTFKVRGTDPPCFSHQPRKDSEQFLKDLHGWLLRHCVPKQCDMGLDVSARRIHHLILEEVESFKNGSARSLNTYFQDKLGFAACDLLREANVRRRLVQFACSNSRLPGDAAIKENERQLVDIREYLLGVHQWLRDVEIHHGCLLCCCC